MWIYYLFYYNWTWSFDNESTQRAAMNFRIFRSASATNTHTHNAWEYMYAFIHVVSRHAINKRTKRRRGGSPWLRERKRVKKKLGDNSLTLKIENMKNKKPERKEYEVKRWTKQRKIWEKNKIKFFNGKLFIHTIHTHTQRTVDEDLTRFVN